MAPMMTRRMAAVFSWEEDWEALEDEDVLRDMFASAGTVHLLKRAPVRIVAPLRVLVSRKS